MYQSTSCKNSALISLSEVYKIKLLYIPRIRSEKKNASNCVHTHTHTGMKADQTINTSLKLEDKGATTKTVELLESYGV